MDERAQNAFEQHTAEPDERQNELFDNAERLKSLKEEKKAMEEAVAAKTQEIETTEQALVQMMIEQELQNFNRKGSVFYLNTRTYASAKAETKEEFYQELKKNGHGDMVVETVNYQTLSAFVRDLLDEDPELPGWLADRVNVFEQTKVGIRKAK